MWADGLYNRWSDGTLHWDYEDGTEPEPCAGTSIEYAAWERQQRIARLSMNPN